MAPRKKSTKGVAPTVTCQECAMGASVYIPCGQPAKVMLGWKGRSETPLPMCEMCADHNVRNRGGYIVDLPLKSVVFRTSSTAVKSDEYLQGITAKIGHNSELSDDALISENFKLEDLIKQAQAKLDEWAKPHKARVAEIEAEISRRLLARSADSTKTDSGTAYFSDIMSTKIESVETLFDFIADNWDLLGADVKLNIPIGTVRTYMDSHDGNLPPGMSNSFYKRLNIKRS